MKKEELELIERLKECISFEESTHGDFNAISWGMEEGILISVNQAKLILKKFEESKEAK